MPSLPRTAIFKEKVGPFYALRVGPSYALSSRSWLQAMRNDPRFIFMASAQASKATDFILSFSRKPEEAPEPTEEIVQV